MSFLKKAILDVKPIMYEARRYRGKVNIQRPRKPHFIKQVTIDLCKPILPKKEDKLACSLGEKKRYMLDVENPFEHILAKECLNWFNHSQMIAFVHVNPVSINEKLPVFSDLVMENMHLRTYGKKIVKMALHGTNYEECIKLFNSHNNIIFSEAIKVDKLLKLLKRIPQLLLMAGIVDGKLLSRNQMIEYSQLPSLDVARAQLCQVLNIAGSTLVDRITQPQVSLVNNLDQYAKIENETDQNKKE